MRRSGDSYKALCPAHEDRNPSLTLREGDKREVVAYCHAGCEFEAIRATLGLDCGGNDHAELQVVESAPTKAGPPETVTLKVWKKLPAGPRVSRYDYRDEEGELVGVVIREDSGDGKTYGRSCRSGTAAAGFKGECRHRDRCTGSLS